MELEKKLEKLEAFKNTINLYHKSYDPEIRSEINRNKTWVKREVLEAGCFKTFTVGPPPAIGGLIMRYVDPFHVLFNPPYGMSVDSIVFDIIDETIGVLMAGNGLPTLSEVSVSPEPD